MIPINFLLFIYLYIRLLYGLTCYSKALLELDFTDYDPPHYKIESVPVQLEYPFIGVISGHIKGSLHKYLVIKDKAIPVPAEQFHTLAVTGKENEYIPGNKVYRGMDANLPR